MSCRRERENQLISKTRGRVQRTLWVAAGTTFCLLFASGAPISAKAGIDHDPIMESKSGQRIEIQAKIKDKTAGGGEVRAYFKSGRDTRFWFAPMHANGGENYLGILPAPALGAETVEYRIYAINGAQDFVKTEVYTINIVDDEEALARMQQQDPTNVEIDLDRIEQMRDLARRGGEPNSSIRVEVRNDVPGSNSPSQLNGFQDYVVMADATPAATSAVSATAGKGIFRPRNILIAAGGGLAVLKALDDDKGSEDHHSDGCCGSTAQFTSVTRTGGDTPAQMPFDLGRTSGPVFLEYDTDSSKTQMRVSYQGRTLFDTGCVTSRGRQRIDFSGSSSRVTIEVNPSCGAGSGARWSFRISWPDSA